MLSLSADLLEATVDLQMINGDERATEGDVAHAKALMHFAESFARRDEAALTEARAALLADAGPEVLVDTAGVAANFQRMVRIADSVGIPLDDRNVAISAGVREELKLQRFHSAKNTPKPSLKLRLMSLIARPIAKRMIKKMEAQRNTSES
jgi:hypothetical protein